MDKIIEQVWAAGFFDGEGNTHFAVGRGRQDWGVRRVQLSISQALHNVEVLHRFAKAVDCGKVTLYPYRSKAVFVASSYDDVFKVIGVIWPYLCSAKRKQAKNCLMEYHQYAIDNPKISFRIGGRPEIELEKIVTELI